jgi:hypothetical protein
LDLFEEAEGRAAPLSTKEKPERRVRIRKDAQCQNKQVDGTDLFLLKDAVGGSIVRSGLFWRSKGGSWNVMIDKEVLTILFAVGATRLNRLWTHFGSRSSNDIGKDFQKDLSERHWFDEWPFLSWTRIQGNKNKGYDIIWSHGKSCKHHIAMGIDMWSCSSGKYSGSAAAANRLAAD